MSTDTSANESTPVERAERVMDHPSPAQRVAAGRRAREAVPRESHDGWKPRPDRRDPVGLLEEQAATRVPELVPIRYGRMLTSPFAFYRGAALSMAADLDTPGTGLKVQLCGDAHLSNAFAHMRAFDIWYARLDADQFRREWEAGASRGEKKRFERTAAKSRTKDSMKAFG